MLELPPARPTDEELSTRDITIAPGLSNPSHSYGSAARCLPHRVTEHGLLFHGDSALRIDSAAPTFIFVLVVLADLGGALHLRGRNRAHRTESGFRSRLYSLVLSKYIARTTYINKPDSVVYTQSSMPERR